jgi:hypothetical protein
MGPHKCLNARGARPADRLIHSQSPVNPGAVLTVGPLRMPPRAWHARCPSRTADTGGATLGGGANPRAVTDGGTRSKLKMLARVRATHPPFEKN